MKAAKRLATGLTVVVLSIAPAWTRKHPNAMEAGLPTLRGDKR